jgi:manganese oxidase
VLCCLAVSRSIPAQQVVAKPGKVRLYFIAADDVSWSYTPRGRHLTGVPATEGAEEGSSTLAGGTYQKSIYQEYTDATFTKLKPRPPGWEHLGILGPLIRAEVGDTIRVVFRNNTKINCSMHPHGLAYDKSSEGASYADGTQGAAKNDDFVPPGGTYTYKWEVPERSGPSHGDASSVLWMYHSHFVEGKDINTGLIGPIIVTGRGLAKPDGAPKDVDREFVTAFAVFDESQSWYFEKNFAGRPQPQPGVNPSDPAFRLPYLVYSINGFIEGNLPGLTMKKGQHVRWYLFATSNEDDVHTPHWHGQTVISSHMRMDTIQLNPMSMAVADMIADNVGTWLFHCHVNDHFEGGMQALFKVLP